MCLVAGLAAFTVKVLEAATMIISPHPDLSETLSLLVAVFSVAALLNQAAPYNC